MKFAHLSDLHLGGWREPKMRELNMQAFLMAMDLCVAEKVDFALFAGDLFNTALPAVDILKIVTKKLREIKETGIPIYAIAGSHDFSPSGKTMIDVLENAGLLVNVCKGEVTEEGKLRLRFTVDAKTGAKITGIVGKKGMLDHHYYEDLEREPLESEEGYKIFMFHTAISELKPKHLEEMEAYPLSLLPRGFTYYAGGHIHHQTLFRTDDYRPITYPGALFPNNFAELEKYGFGGFYIIEDEQIMWKPVKVAEHAKLQIDCNGKSPQQIEEEMVKHAEGKDLSQTVVSMRLSGTIANGKISDIRFNELFDFFYAQNALFVMKNISQLQTEEFQEIKINADTAEDVEEALIKEHLQQTTAFSPEKELALTRQLLHVLNTEKKEGETVRDFEARVKGEVEKIVVGQSN